MLNLYSLLPLLVAFLAAAMLLGGCQQESPEVASTDPKTSTSNIQLTTRFVNSGQAATRRLSSEEPGAAAGARRLELQLDQGQAYYGGSAGQQHLESYKLSLLEIVLCNSVPHASCSNGACASSAQKMAEIYENPDSLINSGECFRLYGTEAASAADRALHWGTAYEYGCTRSEITASSTGTGCSDTGDKFKSYVASFPNKDWLDLADDAAMKKFAVEQAPPAGDYEWGWVRWRKAGIIRAAVPLVDSAGSRSTYSMFTKAAAVVNPNSIHGIDYFPTTVPESVSMLQGPAEDMTFRLDSGSEVYAFQLGATAKLALGQYKLELVYNLDRGVLTAVHSLNNYFSSTCLRHATSVNGCGRSNANVLALAGAGGGMEVKTPRILPVVHHAEDPVIKQTYTIEIPGSRQGSKRKFLFPSSTPWYIRVDMLFVLPSSRKKEGKLDIVSSDNVYGAVMTLLDYFEVADYLGDLYDFGQIARVLKVDGFADEVYASRDPFFSIFGKDFVRLSDVGETGKATVYVVSGGNHPHRCRCDLERPLLKHFHDNPTSIPGAKLDFASACTLTFDYKTFDEYKASGESYLYFPSFVDKKACRLSARQGSETNCADGSVADGDWCESCCFQNFEYKSATQTQPSRFTRPTNDAAFLNANDDYCFQHITDYFGGAGYNTTPSSSGPCINGDGWQCNRQNFASAQGGCAYGSGGWDSSEPLLYQLVSSSEIDYTNNTFAVVWPGDATTSSNTVASLHLGTTSCDSSDSSATTLSIPLNNKRGGCTTLSSSQYPTLFFTPDELRANSSNGTSNSTSELKLYVRFNCAGLQQVCDDACASCINSVVQLPEPGRCGKFGVPVTAAEASKGAMAQFKSATIKCA